MPRRCAYGCNNESKKQTDTAGRGENKVTLYRVPGTDQRELRKKWLIAIGRPKENLPVSIFMFWSFRSKLFGWKRGGISYLEGQNESWKMTQVLQFLLTNLHQKCVPPEWWERPNGSVKRWEENLHCFVWTEQVLLSCNLLKAEIKILH